jgi:ABC-type antimicrobial peptide transport system permease subunit
MASQLWPGADPIGRRLRLGADADSGAWVTVVGVVGRVRQDRLDSDSRMAMYFPHAQFPTRAMNVVLRTAATDPAGIMPEAAAAIRALDPDLPIYNVRTMAERVAASLARRRFAMLLLTLFACLALGLAAIGTYGVIAYLVSQGTRELGIRLALGATPRGIVIMIVRHGVAMGALGIGLGLAGALALAPLMRSLLFGVGPSDPVTYCGIALLLAAVALAASVLPARRAALIDPMGALRGE